MERGGTIGESIHAYGSSTITIKGMLSPFDQFEALYAHDSATIVLVGSGFAVDGVPVPYGDLTALTGTLSGTLLSGHPVDKLFHQGGGEYTGTITLTPPLNVDIRPWSDANPIDPMSRGIIPVAILGSADLDVAEIDVATLAFGPSGAPPALDLTNPFVYWLSHWDVNGDGKKDLLSHYRTQDTGIAIEDSEACLKGETLDGMPIEGCDAITTAACGNGYAAALLVPPVVWVGGRMRRRRG